MGKRAWIVIACATALLLVTIAGRLLLVRDTGSIPYAYTRGLNFALYYPTALPHGYSLDQQSFKRQDDVLIYSIDTPLRKNIAVSEQALPASLPARQISSTSPSQIMPEKQLSLKIGAAHIGAWGDTYVADIVTDKTWIILNVTGITAEEAVDVARAFTKI